ncbi:hypothetical protein B9479_003838 [Cryptococcus floricola]|uniref:SGNH hydrolase-type esterase domain-containing protein n=1 Tax=Cryptococcus floricola TaxID=2591691 RepID=A0A5D3AYV5_9TREE|nr:hypothetical protein B9479_003838 [Cryptococcus floricola]
MAKPLMDSAILFVRSSLDTLLVRSALTLTYFQGDSLTERQIPGSWHELLSKAYSRKLSILNCGFGGYITRWARPIMGEIFAKEGESAGTARLVSIWFGTNDASLDPSPKYTTCQAYHADLTHFLEALTSPSAGYATASNPSALNIILITPPPVYLPQIETPEFRAMFSQERTKMFADVVKDVGKQWSVHEKGKGQEWRVDVLDLWGELALRTALGDRLADYYSDGIHLNAKGYAVLWDLYTDLIKNRWQGRGLDWEDESDLPSRVPHWSVIDLDKPESVLDHLALPKCRQ